VIGNAQEVEVEFYQKCALRNKTKGRSGLPAGNRNFPSMVKGLYSSLFFLSAEINRCLCCRLHIDMFAYFE